VPLDRADALFHRHLADAWAILPSDTRLWDAHTHLGVDDDGFRQSPEQLIAVMDAARVERAFTFPLNDPERVPNYCVPNDRVLAWCEAAPDRLVPFCRLDLSADPIGEANRCLDRGARGIKLHPRAQKFDFGARGLDPVFAVAAERSVPILIHAGRGLPAIADDLRLLVERHPQAQLILAHGAIADLQHIGRTLGNQPNVTYDTSVWSTTDLRALLTTVSPEQVLWASDLPYGQPAAMIIQLARLCLSGRATPEQMHALLWGNTERVSRGQPAAQLSPPLLELPPARSLQHRRIADYVVTTTALLWLYQPDIPGALGLAVRACDVDGSPELADVAELIGCAAELWDEGIALEDREAAAPYTRGAMRLLQVALAILDTP
jgi:uncharacterized protein